MKLAMLSEASEQLKQLQERGLERAVEEAATTVHNMVTRTLAARDSSSTCTADNDSAACEKPSSAGNTQTIAIALGAGIPLLCAVFVLIYLHQRYLRKQKIEDANDPHKSLDFGMMDHNPGQSKWAKQKNGIPEMTVTDMGNGPTRPQRGLSMDMELGSPYLLPAEVSGSRGSIHSMSRSFQDDHDPYRPVTMLKGDADSTRSFPKPGRNTDKASVYSAATSLQSASENSGLIANAQRMSQSFPKRGASQSPHDSMSPHDSVSSDELPSRQMHSQNSRVLPPRKASLGTDSLPSIQEPGLRKDTFSPPPPPPPPEKETRPPRTSSASSRSTSQPPRKQSLPRVGLPTRESSNYGDDAPASLPRINHPDSEYDIDPSMINVADYSMDGQASALGFAHSQSQNQRLSVMGLRPLPSDLPEDNPEIRANRIRSFYKEYFDDSKPNPAGHYEEDVNPAFINDGAIYDPETGGFITAQRPFAQPVGRRAMTPPPRGARGPSGPGGFDPHRRHQSTQSAGRPGPRGRAPPMPTPKKRMPPPAPLKALPTPHLLKDDTAIFNADDFAPPSSYRDRQAGRRPDSPMGGERPYSPSVASHNVLSSAYDELAPMPSPHLLRKSGTFTALDFAAVPRFRGQEGASDAGSIRSNRSGISNVQQNAIRAGAYRVSRIPTEVVGSRDDLAAQLKPSWNMRRGDNIMG